MDTVIEKATSAYLPAIAALEAQTFSFPRNEEMLSRALPGFVLARRGGELCGYADYSAVLDEGYIGNLAVAPFCRRQGIGGALLDALLEKGRAEGLAFLTLEVRESNTAARVLYASRGFETVGRQRGHYSNPTEDALLMTYYYKEG